MAIYRDSGELSAEPVNTIYVGGGTPSILTIEQWERLDDRVFSRVNKTGIKEWSLECNPESFTLEKARAYAKSGVTRLTFGVQSLNDRELSICGRAHSAQRAIEAIKEALGCGLFRSIGADIIYALPGQTVESLDDTIRSLLSIKSTAPIDTPKSGAPDSTSKSITAISSTTIKHLSAYQLTIAENTPFGRHKKALRLPDEDAAAEMYGLIGARCAEHGMAQYEVSNYAHPGFESIHNKGYWTHTPYIGLGASAHSYAHPRRWGNVADVNLYISLASAKSSNNRPIEFEEALSAQELLEEIVFLGLRCAGGIDENDFEARTGTALCGGGRGERLLQYVDSGLLEMVDNAGGRVWRPTARGMLFADMMARGMMERFLRF